MKRVGALYRVSTTKQLDQDIHPEMKDISMQERACKEFIKRQKEWVLAEEYYERGVSGHKKSAEDRDVIQKAIADAKSKKIDVLLVYMFDRLGRIESETPLVVKAFIENDVEVWSVEEGQRTLDDSMDRLFNYLTFWQADNESRKISTRVTEKHRQMVEDGVYRGGTLPFGYRAVKLGELNKRGRAISKVEIDSEQALIVKRIYDLVETEGYGQHRIAKLLNEEGIKTQNGNNWSASAINIVLSNPMYKGYYVYAKGKENELLSKEKKEEWVIVEEDQWERVQEIRRKRNPREKKNLDELTMVSTKGPLLFVGVIKCGHCGSPLTTTYSKSNYTRVDGTFVNRNRARYRCSGKAMNRIECSGQTTYSAHKIESTVLDELHGYLNRLEKVDLTTEIKKIRQKDSNSNEAMLKELQKQLKQSEVGIERVKKKITAKLKGDYVPYDDQMLNEMFQELKNEKALYESQIKGLEVEMQRKQVEVQEMGLLQSYIPEWKSVFDKASNEKKKMMLKSIISSIVVCREGIELNLKLHIKEFLLSTISNVQSTYEKRNIEKNLKYLQHNSELGFNL